MGTHTKQNPIIGVIEKHFFFQCVCPVIQHYKASFCTCEAVQARYNQCIVDFTFRCKPHNELYDIP